MGQIDPKNATPTYINAFYRPPDGKIPYFIESVENQMTSLGLSHAHDILMLGDANIDISKRTSHTEKLNEYLVTT